MAPEKRAKIQEETRKEWGIVKGLENPHVVIYFDYEFQRVRSIYSFFFHDFMLYQYVPNLFVHFMFLSTAMIYSLKFMSLKIQGRKGVLTFHSMSCYECY